MNRKNKTNNMLGRRRPRYYVIVKASPTFPGHAYWHPRQTDKDRYGVERKRLGHHSFGAMALADEENRKLDALKQRLRVMRFDGAHDAEDGERITRPCPYPNGSLGKFYWKWSHRSAFLKNARSTQQEWEQAWKRIGPAFGDMPIRDVSPADVEEFAEALEKSTTEYPRWRTLNKLRELFNAAMAYNLITSTPCGTIKNPQPDGRCQLWLPNEIRALIATAEEMNRTNMALILRLMYQGALAPVDAYTATVEMIVEDAGGWHFKRERTKVEGRQNKRSGVQAAIPTDLALALLAHASPNGATPHPKAKILMRDKTGEPYKRSAEFSDDFMEIRNAALPDEAGKPKREQRKAIDIRRTRNTYAKIGGASKEERAKLLANSIDTNDQLHRTYTPDTVLVTRKVAAAADAGAEAFEEFLKGKGKGKAG